MKKKIMKGIALMAHYTKNAVEGAGSSCLMASYKLREQLKGNKVVVQVSGSNASSEELQQALSLEEFSSGKFC